MADRFEEYIPPVKRIRNAYSEYEATGSSAAQYPMGGNEAITQTSLGLNEDEAKYFNAACNPFFEGSGDGVDTVSDRYRSPKICDELVCSTTTMTLDAADDVAFDVLNATSCAFKLMLPGPAKEFLIPGSSTNKVDAGKTAVQVVHYDGSKQVVGADIVEWKNMDQFRNVGMPYRVVGGGLKIFMNKYGDNNLGGQVYGGYVDEDLMPYATGATATWPPALDHLQANCCPFDVIQNQMLTKEFPLSPSSGGKDGITMRMKMDSRNLLEFYECASPEEEVDRGRSDNPCALCTALPLNTGVRVQAVMHIEFKCKNQYCAAAQSASPYSPRFEELFALVNGDTVQPFIVSGHSFKNWLRGVGRKIGNAYHHVYDKGREAYNWAEKAANTKAGKMLVTAARAYTGI